MKVLIAVAVIAAIVALAGCASDTPTTRWRDPGQTDLQQFIAECVSNGGVIYTDARWQGQATCMDRSSAMEVLGAY